MKLKWNLPYKFDIEVYILHVGEYFIFNGYLASVLKSTNKGQNGYRASSRTTDTDPACGQFFFTDEIQELQFQSERDTRNPTNRMWSFTCGFQRE